MKAKLTDDEVRQVLRLWDEGWGEREINYRLENTCECSETIVRNILRGITYRRVTGGERRMNGKRPKHQRAFWREMVGA